MSSAAQSATDNNARKLGPFWLMPGITPSNGITYFTAAFLSIPMLAALSFLQPLILKIIGIDRAIQGTLSGDLNFYQELVVLFLVPFVGATADKLGRRPLMLAGLAIIACCMLLLAYGFNAATYSASGELIEINATLILIGILGFVAGFGISLGPVMWVLFSELFPNRIRGVAISFVGLINSTVSFIVQLVFPWELENFGASTTFLIYGVFAIIGLIFIMRVLPETKGRSLEELEAELVFKK